jgi:protein-disulfide isomerase
MIPTAAFGLLYYVALLLLCWALLGRVSAWLRWGLGALRWGMAGAAVLLSLWLTFLEAYVIHGWCPWCLSSAGIAVLIFSIASIEILLNGRPERSSEMPCAPLLRHEFGGMLALLLVVLLADGVAIGIFRQVPKPVRLAAPLHNSIRTLLLSGGGYVRGNPSAPYTLVEFGNYACPHCQEGEAGVERILAGHAREMNYVFYYYPLADEATQPPPLAARSAEVAGILGKFWEMHKMLFREEEQQGEISTHWLRATVRDLNLDENHFQQLLADRRIWRMISLEKAVAQSMHVDAVPSFILIGLDGQALRFTGYQALRNWFAAPKNSGTILIRNR